MKAPCRRCSNATLLPAPQHQSCRDAAVIAHPRCLKFTFVASAVATCCLSLLSLTLLLVVVITSHRRSPVLLMSFDRVLINDLQQTKTNN